MKPFGILALLGLSLVFNGVFIYRRNDPGRSTRVVRPDAVRSGAEKTAAPVAPIGKLAAPNDDDLPKLVDTLRVAGIPLPILRAWIAAAIDTRYAERERALAPPQREKYWQPEKAVPLAIRLARIDLQLEKSRLIEELLGYDPSLSENSVYRYLPLDKQQQVKRISAEYTAKIDAHRELAGMMATESEKATISALEEEQKQKLGTLLTESEQEQLSMRTALAGYHPPTSAQRAEGPAPTIVRLRDTLRHFDATEAEFIAIYEIEKEIDPIRFRGGMPSNVLNQQYQERVHVLLGDGRFEEFATKTDPRFARSADISLRAGLTSNHAVEVYKIRDRVIADSARIGNDPMMAMEDKIAALKSLATQGRAQVTAIVGPDPTAAASTANLTDMIFESLDQGRFVVIGPGGGTGFRPVGFSPAARSGP